MYIPFSPPPGIDSDETTFSAEGRWADGSNVRFRSGKAQVIGGWALATTGSVTGICRSLIFYKIASGGNYLVAGTSTKLFDANSGVAAADITPAGFTGGTGTIWSLSTYGDSLIANPSGGKIYQWNNVDAVLPTQLPNSPAQVTFALVTPERQVLAFGCNEELSGTFNPRCIRGCELEDPTDWTTTSSNNAFEHILDATGIIVAAALIGPYVAVWTDRELILGQFLGEFDQTYRFDRVATGCGLIGQNAMCVVGTTAYWLSPDLNIYAWTPGSDPQVVKCPLSKDFRDNITAVVANRNRCFAARVFKYNEIWFFYPRGSATECSDYIAFSLDDGAWFKGTLQRSAWIDRPNGVFASSIIAATSGGVLYNQETGSSANGAALDWFIQSADQSLDNDQTRIMVRGIVPDLKDQIGSVSLTVYCRDRPQSTPVAKGPYILTAGSTKKDFRASGKLISIRLSGSAAGTYARLGKPLFDTVALGQR
jgi:hypothetical protein